MTTKCEICGKEFQSEAALGQHRKDKHGIEGQQIPVPGESVQRQPDKGEGSTGGRPKQREKRRKYRHGRSKKKLLAIAVPILIVVIVTSVYFYDTNSTQGYGASIYGTKVGYEAPDFPVTLTNGTVTYLSSLRPHPTLLWFVATWCNSCYEGVSILKNQYYQTLRSNGLEIMVVELYNDLNQSAPAGSGIPNNITQFAELGGGTGKPGWFYGTSNWDTTHTYDPAANLDVFYVLNQYGIITMTNLGLPNFLSSIASQSFSPAQLPAFPFPCLAESTAIHIHPWLRIVINGQNVTIPAAVGIENPSFETAGGYKVAVSGSCFEPLHTHDSSGIIHIESGTNSPFTLGDFFRVWQATYGTVAIDGSAHPIVFNPTDILGFKADATHEIVVLVDGKPSTQFSSLVLNQLDYCDASSTGPPCYPTAGGNPYYNGQTYPYGTENTIVIEYVTT